MFRTFLATLGCLLVAGVVVAQPAPQDPATDLFKDPKDAPAAAVVPVATLTASFLFNLARFTEWPPETSARPVTLCVLGDPAVADTLDRLTGNRQITGRDVSVARLVSLRALRLCHLLYVAGADADAQARALDQVARLPVLTIGHGEPFVRMGGVVGLIVENGRKRFAINTDAVQRAGLTISSRLLGLAKVVRDEHGQQ
jgi:hypothetical protein